MVLGKGSRDIERRRKHVEIEEDRRQEGQASILEANFCLKL